MDMEVEASSLSNTTTHSITSFKRFGIKNSIQTNFGDDYVFQIDSSPENSTLAVSLSTNAIKFYSAVTGQYIGECKGHSAPINQISFSCPSSPHVLQSCSSDGTLRAWDTRTFNQVSSLIAGSHQEVFSFSFGGSSNNLLAAGCKSEVLIWDWRNGKQVACLEESHMDDVTQVHFSPGHRNKLISASVDGLMCTFDTEGNINDDDHLESVMNVGTSIGKIGFCGEMNDKIWCLTHIETLSIWDWKDSRNEVNFQDARTLASDSWTLGHVDYFVDCHYSGADDRLWVIGGTNAGSLGYFPVDHKGIGSPEAVLEGGHVGIVRTVLPMSCLNGGRATNQSIFGWTGGEDGRLCCWLSDESTEVNRSWISNALVMKSPKTTKKNRHHPY
ncbi:Wd repeat-containing protein gts1 [Thalictrum thalictroides]|uniref:Wd repeat-containing protein gts1 n=1 Tax=Thalictrum thalictroides TaxID=46969 RepID=A0A7J6VXW5_THATH|nr:Wd repeat-containing protein gts1 [Thalictrum thalictroides]